MNAITKKRNQRIAEMRKKKISARNRKVTTAVIAGTIAAVTLLSTKAAACSTDYTVKKGDTLYSLAKKYQVTTSQLMQANGLTSEKIIAGQTIYVPDHPAAGVSAGYTAHLAGEVSAAKDELLADGVSAVYTVKKGDTLFSLAKKYKVSVAELKKENHLKTDTIKVGQTLSVPHEFQGAPEMDAVYTVFPGDTVWGMAKRFGMSVDELKKANGLRQDMVLIGQKLEIPGTAYYSEAKITGAADRFTVEFAESGVPLILKVAYGQASDYQKKSGQTVTVIHKNGALIAVY